MYAFLTAQNTPDSKDFIPHVLCQLTYSIKIDVSDQITKGYKVSTYFKLLTFGFYVFYSTNMSHQDHFSGGIWILLPVSS